MAALSFLTCVAQSIPGQLATFRVAEVNAALVGLLRNVPVEVASAPNTKRPKNVSLVEVDGNRIRDFFTVLNLATTRWYTLSQIMSCHVFSMLRGWIDAVYCHRPQRTDATGELNTSTRSAADNDDNGEGPDPLTDTVRDSIIEYCFRVLQQCALNLDDKTLDAMDKRMIQGAALEVIGIFEALCTADPSVVPRLLPEIKRLDKRCSDPADAVVSLALMRFFIKHQEVVVYDLQPALTAHFGTTVFNTYDVPLPAAETLQFCVDHQEYLTTRKVL